MSDPENGVRTTIYLAGAAAEVLDHLKREYRERYGIATTVSAVFARLLLGETINEVVERPYRRDLARIASEVDKLRDDVRRVLVKRRGDLHRIHREIAGLYPRVKQISNTLGRAKRRNEPYSPDFAQAAQIEQKLDELMMECADAILPRRRR
jgi:hypothetical protein